MGMAFEPTHEWQRVPDDAIIPAGLDIRMDINKGGKWARLPADQPGEDTSSSRELALSHAELDLDELEDLAHDIEDGAEIFLTHGAQLFDMYTNPQVDESSETAGRILTACLRNNDAAAKEVQRVVPDLVGSLCLADRPISLASALVSTSEGAALVRTSGALQRLQRELAYASEISPSLAQKVRLLLQNLAVGSVDDEAMCQWVDALSQAYFRTKNEVLRETAVEIVEHTGDFENLEIECHPQPGILPEQSEKKRAAETAHRLANPKAERNHFDEL